MKKLTLIFTLLVSIVILPSTSSAGWTYVTTEENSGNMFYIDFERIRKNGGFVYYWVLQNLSRRDEDGIMSGKIYYQADCRQFRFKHLSFVYYSKQMGSGRAQAEDAKKKHWYYPPPSSVGELILKSICKYTN